MSTVTELRAGMLAWWRESPTRILAGEVESINGSIVTLRRGDAVVELNSKRVHAKWRDADADSPLPAGERTSNG